jgi:hypothetical protein
LEKALEDWVRKSSLTEQIASADQRVDRALTAIKVMVRAQKYSLSTSVAEAANRVYIMLSDYGKVNNEAYEKQSGDVQSILRQLTSGGPYYADASTLNLSTQIAELQAAYALFEQLLAQRDDKSLQKPDKSFKEIREGIEPVYHQVEAIINAGALTSSSPTSFVTFINHLNPEIDRTNAEFHRVRHNIAHAEPEAIGQQVYTGQALTPVPKVLYVTPHDGTVRLELGKDFNLTYKNNTEVGNAECTIHGKGAYKGHKTVTFIIARAL